MKQNFQIEATVCAKDRDLEKLINNFGIEYPHPSLAFFKSVYAPIEQANKNGVRLAESVKQDLCQLRGTQVNFNHNRSYNVCGCILDAWTNENNEIEIAFSFFKTLYEKEYENALKLFEQGKLTVSFELRVDNDQIEVMADGTRRLHRVEFDGVGLLMGVRPAYPKAIVFEKAMHTIKNMLNQNSPDLVFANAKDVSKFWTEIGKELEQVLTDNKGEHLKMDKKAQEALLAKQKSFVIEEFGEEAVKDWTDEDFLNQDKIEALRKSLKAESEEVTEEKPEDVVEEPKADASEDEAKDAEDKEAEEEKEEVVEEKEEVEEEKPEEPVVEEKVEEEKEEKVEEASEETAEVVKVETEETRKVTDEYDTDSGEEKITVETEETRKVDDKVVEQRKKKEEVMYTYAQVEEIKAEYEEKLKAKDEQIAFYKENAKKVAELRAELGKFAETLSDEELFDEDKLENARLKRKIAKLEAKELTASEDDAEEKEEVEEEKPEADDLAVKEDVEEEKEEVKEEEEKPEDKGKAVKNLVTEKYKKLA